MLEESHQAAPATCLSRRALIVARLCKLLQPPGQRDERISGTPRLCPCESPADCQSTIGRQQAVLKFYREQTGD